MNAEPEDTERRLIAAFRAIADAVRVDGWRLVTDDGLVVRRDARMRARGITLRRLCDNGTVDAVRILLTDSLSAHLGDLDLFVKVAIEELRERDKADPETLPYLGQRGVSFARDDAFYTSAECEQAYQDGKASGRRDRERRIELAGLLHRAPTDAEVALLEDAAPIAHERIIGDLRNADRMRRAADAFRAAGESGVLAVEGWARCPIDHGKIDGTCCTGCGKPDNRADQPPFVYGDKTTTASADQIHLPTEATFLGRMAGSYVPRRVGVQVEVPEDGTRIVVDAIDPGAHPQTTFVCNRCKREVRGDTPHVCVVRW